MGSLKEIRTRISSVTSTRQITSAMKMVSAAKLRKAQDAIIRIRPYAGKLYEILSGVMSSLEMDDNSYARQGEKNNILIVLITSNRGLCGAFNSNAIKKALELAGKKYPEQLKRGNVTFYTIGKSGGTYIRSKKYNVTASNTEIYDHLNFENVATIAGNIMGRFLKKEFDVVEIVYNQFKNAASQILTSEGFLPVDTAKFKKQDPVNFDYIFEPSKEYIVTELIPKSLKIQFYKAILDSYAAEHGARMTAMHKATDNATELIHELRLHYNKARQASITGEILEIVGGAEALKG